MNVAASFQLADRARAGKLKTCRHDLRLPRDAALPQIEVCGDGRFE